MVVLRGGAISYKRGTPAYRGTSLIRNIRNSRGGHLAVAEAGLFEHLDGPHHGLLARGGPSRFISHKVSTQGFSKVNSPHKTFNLVC
jgi:hypothetical protein